MSRKVMYKSIQRATKSQNGIYAATLLYFASNVSVNLGTIVRHKDQGLFEAFDTQDALVDSYSTLQRAGEGLRKLYDATLEAETESNAPSNTAEADEQEEDEAETLLTLQDAAAQLCPNAADPVKALRKRINRGSVQTRETEDGTMVVVS